MINIRSMRKLQDNDGMTLKNGQKVCYKTGWQVATQGIETKDIHEAMRVIKQVYKGNCGIWYSEGIYYIDCSHRVKTKTEAMKIGKRCAQQTVLKWATMEIIEVK